VKQDGTLWCWQDDKAPAQVAGLAGVTQASAGAGVTCALAGGDASCWGDNRYGQLGDGTLVDRDQPVAVVGLGDVTLASPSDGTAHVPDGAIVQSWDGAPAGCTHAPVDSLDVMSSYAERVGDTLLSVKIASYHLDPGTGYNASEDPRGAQRVLVLDFTHDAPTGDRARQPIDPAVYALDASKPRFAEVKVLDRAGDHQVADVYAAGVHAGEIELTRVDDQWICGSLRVKTADASYAGPFAAAVTSAPRAHGAAAPRRSRSTTRPRSPSRRRTSRTCSRCR
jgi:hypothetical protein